MPEIKKYVLENGLVLVVDEDTSTPMVAVNILYKVGSRNEQNHRTGFAHLFEHLMFGGSVNIPSFDEPLQMVGGENNAFTNSDITNYYITVPADNIETALWLESDRMLELNFSEQGLKVQQNVVSEEFRQRYLNQPYGDIWLLMRPLAFRVHPYQWPTIGKTIDHIQEATLDEVKAFFYAHYAPNNAIITISGNIKPDKAFGLVKKWFGDIPSRNIQTNPLPSEPAQTEPRNLTVSRKVPFDAVYKTWHTGDRLSREFQVSDMITDILSGGKSGRLYQELVKEKRMFSDINAFVTGEIDPGLIVLGGKLIDGISPETAGNAIEELLSDLKTNPVEEPELGKVKNKFESNFMMGQTHILNKAMGLAFFEMLGDAAMMYDEISRYNSIDPDEIQAVARKIFQPSNCSTLYYLAERNGL